MKVECENLSEQLATPKLIRDLVRDDKRRGEFMILIHDDEAFVQVSCDSDQVEGSNGGSFVLEYRESKNGRLFHCTQSVSAREVENIFLDELDGRGSWRNRYTWEPIEGYGSTSSTGGLHLPGIKKLVWILPLVFVLAYAAHAAYLWHMHGPPTGFCTKCTIYWGKHHVVDGKHCRAEHAPLQWSR